MIDGIPDPGPNPPRRRRLLPVLLVVLPVVIALAVMWGRSYFRRDAVVWEQDRPQARRALCRVCSSRGRILFLSYSRPIGDGTGGRGAGARRPISFHTGDLAATRSMAEEVRTQARQAGLEKMNFLGMGYSQHIGTMESGSHVWTAAAVPWWFAVVVAAGAIACGGLAPMRRSRTKRNRLGLFRRRGRFDSPA